METVEIEFWLAKKIYEWHHKTHKPPVGHMASFALLDDINLDSQWGLLYDAWEHEFGNDKSAFIEARDLQLMSDKYALQEIKLASRYDDNYGDWMMYSLPRILGICSIGRPIARFKNPNVFELTRICFLEDFNPKTERKYTAPSKFITEATNLFKYFYQVPNAEFVTYIHANQSGEYLKYAGFLNDKIITYKPDAKGWGSRSTKLGDLKPKKRFFKEAV